jgi:hypothetical protein
VAQFSESFLVTFFQKSNRFLPPDTAAQQRLFPPSRHKRIANLAAHLH